METAVVTAIGSFSADIVIKTLKKKGMRVIGCDIYPREWIADSENVDRFYKVPYATDKKAYVNSLLTICREEKAQTVVVLTDAEVDVLSGLKKEFSSAGVVLCLPPEKTIDLCRDKRAFSRFLSERKIGNTILTEELQRVKEDELFYPVVVKPYNGRSSQGLSYVTSKEELRALKARVKPEDFVVQPFLEGSIITADVVRQADTGEAAVICRKELLRTKNGAGTSVLVFCNERLEAVCREAAEALGINGCVNFEFIKDKEGAFHMLECNPRFSGGVEFSCMAGYDCVNNHLRCFEGQDIEVCGKITSMYIARKYEEYITRVNKTSPAVSPRGESHGQNGGNYEG